MTDPINETKLRQTAVSFPYPATPDVVPAFWERVEKQSTNLIGQRRLAFVALSIILLAVIAVPPVRASLITFFRIGTINVYVGESDVQFNSTPIPLPNLSGQMTLAEAQAAVSFPIEFPSTLGEPDAVYHSDDWQGIVTLVWQENGTLLQILDFNIIGTKIQLEFAEETAVYNAPALWIEDPHLLNLYDERIGFIDTLTRQVDGHVLIWTKDNLTYRLETHLPKEEAISLAEIMTKK